MTEFSLNEQGLHFAPWTIMQWIFSFIQWFFFESVLVSAEWREGSEGSPKSPGLITPLQGWEPRGTGGQYGTTCHRGSEGSPKSAGSITPFNHTGKINCPQSVCLSKCLGSHKCHIQKHVNWDSISINNLVFQGKCCSFNIRQTFEPSCYKLGLNFMQQVKSRQFQKTFFLRRNIKGCHKGQTINHCGGSGTHFSLFFFLGDEALAFFSSATGHLLFLSFFFSEVGLLAFFSWCRLRLLFFLDYARPPPHND